MSQPHQRRSRAARRQRRRRRSLLGRDGAHLSDAPLIAAVDVRGGGPGHARERRASDLAGIRRGGARARALWWLGVRAFRRDRRAELARRARHGLRHRRSARADRSAGRTVRSSERRRTRHWGASPPYEGAGAAGLRQAGLDFALGSAGAGFGATTATLRGGLGQRLGDTRDGLVVGALVAVNAVGTVTIGDTRAFLGGAVREGRTNSAASACRRRCPDGGLDVRLKGGPARGDDASPSWRPTRASRSAQAYRLAVMAQTGLARAIYPVHTPLDGDVVFAVATATGHARRSDREPDRSSAARPAMFWPAPSREACTRPPRRRRNWRGPPAWRTRFGHAG